MARNLYLFINNQHFNKLKLLFTITLMFQFFHMIILQRMIPVTVELLNIKFNFQVQIQDTSQQFQ